MCRKVIFYCLVLCTGTLGSLMSIAPAIAQQDESEVLRKMFGLGIHQYNAGNFVQAYDSFSTCIEAKSKNPSVYYFRGLCLMQLGRAEDATEDFQAGAAMELNVTNSTALNQVGYDLQNVQGNLRLTLEQYRTEAKLKAYQNRQSVVALQQGAATVNAVGGAPMANFQYEEAPGSYSIDGDTSLEDPLADDTAEENGEDRLQEDPLADDSLTEEDEGLDSILDDSETIDEEADEEADEETFDDSLDEGADDETALEDEASFDDEVDEEDADADDDFSDEDVTADEEMEEEADDETMENEEFAEEADEEITDEEEADEEITDEEVADEEITDEEVADEEITDEEVADEEITDEEETDEEEASDEPVAPEEDDEDIFDE